MKTRGFAVITAGVLLLLSAGFAHESLPHPETMRLMFAGDIMGHRSQIAAAYNPKTKTYRYDTVFEQTAHILKKADFAIANLELTFGGKPYSGFPQFSSPDTLADAIKHANIHVLMTANNHSADRGCQGIQRTLSILDQKGIRHTGTFTSEAQRHHDNLLILRKGTLTAGILNYTQDTNGIRVRPPCLVNRIRRDRIREDVDEARARGVDALIVFLHWGEQYHARPTRSQRDLAQFLRSLGVDMIIGAHPHVLQPMAYHPETNTTRGYVIAYSLGNFISNQQRPGRDGGAILQIDLHKEHTTTRIANARYYLTWVHRYYARGQRHYEITPCTQSFFQHDKRYYHRMKRFVRHATGLFRHSHMTRITTDTLCTDAQSRLAFDYFRRAFLDELVIP